MHEQILLVDDDPRLLGALEIRLKAAGYGVQTAPDGFEGISAAALFRPDAIILDVRMPVMDGHEVCRLMRAIPELCDIPIIILSASGERSTSRTVLEAGGNVFVKKPYQAQELLQILRDALDKRHPVASPSCRTTAG